MNQSNIIPRSLRTYCVSVRLNNAELQLLNTKRGTTSKGEWLRMASLQKHQIRFRLSPDKAVTAKKAVIPRGCGFFVSAK